MIKQTLKRFSNLQKSYTKSRNTEEKKDRPVGCRSEMSLMDNTAGCCLFTSESFAALPLWGGPTAFLWPLAGLSAGMVLKLLWQEHTPEAQATMLRYARRGAVVLALVGGGFLLKSVERVPYSGRFRLNCKWPWKDPSTVADLDADAEKFLETKVLSKTHTKPIWVQRVFDAIAKGNSDIPHLEPKKWKIKVIDDSLNILMCFVVPKTRCIYMSDFYLRLVRDDAQLGYTLGHELSHMICSHAKDFCFMDSSREGFLFITGAAVGWHSWEVRVPASESNWQLLLRTSRFFMIAGLSCYALAILTNLLWILPFRRKLELEADVVGLKFAAKACMDVNSIPSLWENLSFVNAVPEWRSTHPSCEKRETILAALMPWAHWIRLKHHCEPIPKFEKIEETK